MPGDGALAAAGGEHAGPLRLVLRRRHRQARADDVNISRKCVFNKYLWLVIASMCKMLFILPHAHKSIFFVAQNFQQTTKVD